MRGSGRLEFHAGGLAGTSAAKCLVCAVGGWGRLVNGPRGAGQVGQEPKDPGGRMHLEFNMTLKVRGRFWFICRKLQEAFTPTLTMRTSNTITDVFKPAREPRTQRNIHKLNFRK